MSEYCENCRVLQATIDELKAFIDRVASDDTQDNYWMIDAIEVLKEKTNE